jgi:HSP20 family molecular chaperone IbpA
MTEHNTQTLDHTQEASNTAVMAPKDQAQWAAMTDLYETHEAMVVFLDIPGVREDGLEVTLEKDHLTVTARSHQDLPEGGLHPAWTEFVPATFHRRFHLTPQIDREGIQAQLKDGVLRLTLPKVKEVAARRIVIKTQS